MTQAEAVRLMRARGIHVTESELSRWKSARYARSRKVPKVYRFLFGDDEKSPAQEGGADEIVTALTDLRAELVAAREDAASDREAMVKMLADLRVQIGRLALPEGRASRASGRKSDGPK